MNRVRKLAMELISLYPNKFTADYEANKKALGELAIFRSKSLRNEVAGYITRYYKMEKEQREKEQVEVKGAAPAS